MIFRRSKNMAENNEEALFNVTSMFQFGSSRPGSVTSQMTGNITRRTATSGKTIRFDDIRRENWYFKDVPPVVAEAILRKQNPGDFLVSQLGTVSIKLHLLTTKTVKQYEIETVESEGKTYYKIGKGCLFASIQQLIDHFKKSPGLGIKLEKYPSKKYLDELFTLNLNEVNMTQPFELHLPWDVHFGAWRKIEVIVQQGRPTQGSSDDQKALFSRHSKILMAVKHDNIASLLGCGVDVPRSFLVTESLSEGSLLNYLHRNTMSLLLRPNDLLKIARSICQGMEYLEQKRIVHNELVAENCVIDEVCNVKLTGFHLARYEGDYESLLIPNYVYKVKLPPPEFYQNQFSCRSDVWSFGFLLWTVFKRGQDESCDVDRILHGDWGTRLPVTIIGRARQLIASCLIEIPEHRPKFKEILPYLHEENFPGPPYRFRDYSSEEATASSASGENSSPDDEPRAKIIKAPYSAKAKTKFASMSNLTEDSSITAAIPSKPSPPPRNDLNKTPTPTAQVLPAVKFQRRSHSAVPTPFTELKPVTIDETDASLAGYSSLKPQTAFHTDSKPSSNNSRKNHESNSNKHPHDHKNSARAKENLVSSLPKQEAAPHILAAGTSATEDSAPQKVPINENQDCKPANQNAPTEKPHTRLRVNAAKPPPSPVRSQTISPSPNHEKQPSSSCLKQKVAPKPPFPGSSESAVCITPAGSQSPSTSHNRFGFDRSTPKPDKKDASEGQFTAITGSAIVISANNHDEDEPSTFMEYDVSNASSLRKGNETVPEVRRQGVIPEEEFLALQEMLDYAAERIQFSEYAKQEATREKNLIISEISKTELKCMTEVEELSRVFFKHVQDLQCRLMDSDEAGPSSNTQTSDQKSSDLGKDIKTKRLNEMKLRGRIALKQLKQELRSAWTQNREMMGKIALLSHSEMASLPLHDRRGQVDNMYENVDEEMRTERDLSSTEDTSAPVVNQDSKHVNKSLPKLAQREETQYSVVSSSAGHKSQISMPKCETPGHVLEFLRKFLASNDVSALEKTHVQIVFKALDQAYSDQQKLKSDMENLKNNQPQPCTKTNEEDALKNNEQAQEYKSKIIKLRNRLAAVMEENEHLKCKNETLQQFAHNAHSVIEATREKVMERDKLEQQCHTLKQNLSSLESQMAENEKNFRGTLANLRQELREALDGKKHFENEINKLLQQTQRGAVSGGIEGFNLMDRLQQLERERLEAEARAEALAENLNVLTSRMEAQEYQIHHDKCTIEKLRRDLELLQKQTQIENQPQYQSLVTQVKHLEMKLQTAETRLAETVCERDQFKFLYDLTLQKVKAYDEKSSKHVSKAEKKLMKQNEAAVHGNQESAPKKTSALTLLEKKLLNKGSSSKNNSNQSLPPQTTPQTVSFGSGFNNPGYGTSSGGVAGESEKTSLNSNITVASSTGATVGTTSAGSAKINHRPKLVSPRIAKSPVPQITYHSQSAETITPLTPGKLKGKWHAL